MRVLVTAASKHGATNEIGETIADVLRQRGLDVTIATVDDVQSLDAYDAVILGSAIYVGRWLKSARQFVARHGGELASRSVWLFSSGPIGDPAMPKEEAVDIAEMMRITGARGHRTFAGKLARGDLGLAEKMVATALRVKDGDFRDWRGVAEWAATIAEALIDARPDREAATAHAHEQGVAR